MDYAPTVDPDRSSILRTFVPHLDQTAIALSAVFPEERVARVEASAGRSLWADELTGAIFCTDH